MSYTYLQDAGAESSAASFSDITLFAPLKSNPTAAACSCNGSGMACCHASQFGMTCEPSTGSRGGGGWMWYAVDSLVRTSRLPAQPGQDSTASVLDCGLKWKGLLARFDRGSCSWKTHQQSLFEGLDVFSQGWPRWGIMLRGECWELATPVRRMNESECGYLPTPTKQWGKKGQGMTNNLDNLRMGLRSVENALAITAICGWRWPASLIEWMMGWPIGWTALKPLETDKFRKWLRSHGAC